MANSKMNIGFQEKIKFRGGTLLEWYKLGEKSGILQKEIDYLLADKNMEEKIKICIETEETHLAEWNDYPDFPPDIIRIDVELKQSAVCLEYIREQINLSEEISLFSYQVAKEKIFEIEKTCERMRAGLLYAAHGLQQCCSVCLLDKSDCEHCQAI